MCEIVKILWWNMTSAQGTLGSPLLFQPTEVEVQWVQQSSDLSPQKSVLHLQNTF